MPGYSFARQQAVDFSQGLIACSMIPIAPHRATLWDWYGPLGAGRSPGRVGVAECCFKQGFCGSFTCESNKRSI